MLGRERLASLVLVSPRRRCRHVALACVRRLRGPWSRGESDETGGTVGACVNQWAKAARARLHFSHSQTDNTGPSLHSCQTLSVCVCVCACLFMRLCVFHM